jgi:glycyl-tRNA synthetase beta subunit
MDQTAYARCVRITRSESQIYPVDEKLFEEPMESKLYKAILEMEKKQVHPNSVDEFLKTFTSFVGDVNAYFENVMVMAENPKVRQNRLGMLQKLVAVSAAVADFAQLQGF